MGSALREERELIARIDAVAQRERRSRAFIFREAVEEYLERHDPQQTVHTLPPAFCQPCGKVHQP